MVRHVSLMGGVPAQFKTVNPHIYGWFSPRGEEPTLEEAEARRLKYNAKKRRQAARKRERLNKKGGGK